MSPHDGPATLAEKMCGAAERLNACRRRASRNGLTANELDSILPGATSITSREAFYEACRRAVADAVNGFGCARARRLAERRTIFDVLEQFRLIKRT